MVEGGKYDKDIDKVGETRKFKGQGLGTNESQSEEKERKDSKSQGNGAVTGTKGARNGDSETRVFACTSIPISRAGLPKILGNLRLSILFRITSTITNSNNHTLK